MFDGILGQEGAIASLRRQLARTAGSGSTLIVGPEGTGRFLLALAAAAEVLAKDAAGRSRVLAQQHSDLHVLLPEEGIKGVRAAVEMLARRPVEAPRQVLIVRDADALVVEASTTLLKTLEEPPADASIFVIAEGTESLPETIVSRCRVVRARPLPEALMRRFLAGRGLPEEAASEAEGSPGRAIYQHGNEIGQAATRLLALLTSRGSDPVGEALQLVGRQSGEEAKEQRRRVGEILRVVASRLCRDLPESEPSLRCVLERLRSVEVPVSAAVLFAELALRPWKTRTTPSEYPSNPPVT